MSPKPGLGRGLEALIPGGDLGPSEGGVTNLPVQSINPNPRQPRRDFHTEGLDELTTSIREHGVIQPLIVTPAELTGQYTLIAGERRLQAARLAGLSFVPAIIRVATDQQRLELALIENLQREDLSPLEEAEAYRQLYEDFHLSHEEIAQRVSKSRVAVTNTMRLLRLPDSVKNALVEGRISEGHARALLALPSPEAQSVALKTVIGKDLTVRKTEELVRKISGEKKTKAKKQPMPEIAEIEERLRSSLGTKVTLRAGKKGGSITIHYYSNEELDSLLQRLTKEI